MGIHVLVRIFKRSYFDIIAAKKGFIFMIVIYFIKIKNLIKNLHFKQIRTLFENVALYYKNIVSEPIFPIRSNPMIGGKRSVNSIPIR